MASTKKSNDRQSQSKKPTSTSLSENFHRYFRLQFANSKALRRHTCKIRHKAYCNELGWEDVLCCCSSSAQPSRASNSD